LLAAIREMTALRAQGRPLGAISDGDIVPLAQLLAQPFQHLNPAFREPSEQKHALPADRIDDARKE
jgi:hypothetical protein